MKKKSRYIGYGFLVTMLLVAGLFLLNFYLTRQLEKYLKKELASRTADATDGFYRLAFDDLTISLFKGELKIEGVQLAPDPAIFRSWTERDSLPSTYVTARIGVIDFKGVNLTWRWSYKRLHFKSFEIRQPDIHVFNSYYSSRTEKKVRQAETKTLYEVISPYIDRLSVGTLNLENASASYTVEDPMSPIFYALTNVSFHGYDFLLDENSSDSGKLLYCDNFDFVTNQPQRLLANNDFSLETERIRLSTEDSVISISRINLSPQPGRYLKALVESVEVSGIAFRREEALNYLTARSFQIDSSEIQAFSPANETHPEEKLEADSIVQSLSLYQIISPVLHSVSIQQIGIGKAKLQYSFAVADTVEVYKLDNFDFQAHDFQVDSLSEGTHGFWYSRDFAFEATGIEGLMSARNHRFNIKRMALDTKSGDFSIEKFRLRPLSTRGRNDYMAGSVDAVRIRGMHYEDGISAELLRIDRPDIRYVVGAGYQKEEVAAPVTANDSRVDVDALLNPFLRYLSVKKINLNDASVVLDDRSALDPVTYQLKHFHFFATDIRMDHQTGKSPGLFFDYGNMGFSFSDFDNYLPGKAYRLSVGKGTFSTLKGVLWLQDIALVPQDSSSAKAPGLSFSASVPSLYVGGLHRLPDDPAQQLKVGAFRLLSPDIRIFKRDSSVSKPAAPVDLYKQLSAIAGQMTLDTFALTNARVMYEQQVDSISLVVEGLRLDNVKRTFALGDIHFSTRHLAFPLDNGFYRLEMDRVDLVNRNLQVDGLHLYSPYPKMEFAYLQPQHKDWFEVEVGSLSVSDIDLPAYFADQVLRMKDVQVNNAVLRNFKNQKIAVPRRVVPMIYSGLQKAPIKLKIERVEVNNLSVVYEELAKKGTVPGKLFFTDMNGVFSGFTNIVSDPDAYIRLDANGKLMGEGRFTATWMLPVDSLNDRFLLNAHLTDFDLTALNPLITPLAPAQVHSGWLRDLTFDTEASSKGAAVNMLFLYKDLRVTLLKEKAGELTDNKLLTSLVNRVLKHDNPDRTKREVGKPRHSNVTLVRDPYHSTFNYIWQILRPALVESVGVSQKKQDAAKDVMTFFTKVKHFFRGKKSLPPTELQPDTEEAEPLLPDLDPQHSR